LHPTFNPDELDIGILRELHSPNSRWNFKESYPRMAKTLHVDVETVRRRVSRMERLGAIEGWAIMPNPHLLEKECMVLYFETSDDSKKRDLTGILGHTEGITSVHSFHGGSLLVLLEYPKEIPAETQIAQMETLCGTQATMAWTMRFPPFGLTMTPTDWLILHSLRKEPRRRLSEIAQEVGISLRTLNRRMERLVEGDAFFLELLSIFRESVDSASHYWSATQCRRRRGHWMTLC